MRTVAEVLREKQEAIAQIQKEIEALRVVANMLGEEPDKLERKPEYRQLLQMP